MFSIRITSIHSRRSVQVARVISTSSGVRARRVILRSSQLSGSWTQMDHCVNCSVHQRRLSTVVSLVKGRLDSTRLTLSFLLHSRTMNTRFGREIWDKRVMFKTWNLFFLENVKKPFESIVHRSIESSKQASKATNKWGFEKKFWKEMKFRNK